MVDLPREVSQYSLPPQRYRRSTRFIGHSSSACFSRAAQGVDEARGGNGLRFEPHCTGVDLLPGADTDRVDKARDGMGSALPPFRAARLLLAPLPSATTEPTPLRKDVLKGSFTQRRKDAKEGAKESAN